MAEIEKSERLKMQAETVADLARFAEYALSRSSNGTRLVNPVTLIVEVPKR